MHLWKAKTETDKSHRNVKELNSKLKLEKHCVIGGRSLAQLHCIVQDAVGRLSQRQKVRWRTAVALTNANELSRLGRITDGDCQV